MKKTYLIYPILLILLILSSCNRESTDIITEKPPVINPPEIIVRGSVIGQVLDIEEASIANASVHINGSTIITDQNGMYFFENIELFEDGTLLKVEKDGYFLGSRTFNAFADETNQVSIVLTEQNFNNNLSTDGGKIESDNYTIDFPSGSYIKANGDLYNGNFIISSQWLDPTTDNFHYQIPGELKGYTLTGEIQSLQSLSVMAIEIANDNGESIQLPENETALIKFPIPSQYSDFAPATIPLWYYDENNGLWIEEGQATLVQSHYEADIPHFSYWACHLPYESIQLKGSLLLNGEMFSDTKIKISDNKLFSAASQTTLDGEFIFTVPKESSLKFDIAHDCKNTSQSLTIVSQSTDQTLNPITIKPDENNILIEGNILSCNSNPVTEGFVRLDLENKFYLVRTNNSGQFSHGFNTCQLQEATIYAIDVEQGYSSPAFTFPINSNVNVSDINACENFDFGHDVSYTNMNWINALNSEAEHSWTISSIQSGSQKFIFNPVIYNPNSGETYMTGAFIFEQGSSEAEFILDFKTQGFSISGTCNLVKNELSSYSSFRFSGSSNSISVIDNANFPSGINEVTFDLVYYN